MSFSVVKNATISSGKRTAHDENGISETNIKHKSEKDDSRNGGSTVESTISAEAPDGKAAAANKPQVQFIMSSIALFCVNVCTDTVVTDYTFLPMKFLYYRQHRDITNLAVTQFSLTCHCIAYRPCKFLKTNEYTQR